MSEKRKELQSFVNVDEVNGALDVAADDYHNDRSSISKTMLSVFHHSPFNYWCYYVGQCLKPPRIKAGLIGKVCHDVLLLGKPLDDVAKRYPQETLKKNGAINPHAARPWLKSLPSDQYAVKDAVYVQIDMLLCAVKSHPVIELIQSATAREKPIYWTDDASGLICRCRPDFVHELDEEIVCYDLKFTDQFWSFWRTARAFKYWMQDAHYSRGLSRVSGKPVKFVFWAVETTAPFRIARHEYHPESRENAWREVGETLERLKQCGVTGDWSDRITRETNYLYFESYESSPELDWS